MSSHHFVKEGQEPALLILEPVSFSNASSLLEWAPLVLVFEAALEQVMLWGIKIDVVLSHSKSREHVESLLENHFPIEVIYYSDEKELFNVCFDYLEKRNQFDVNIIAHNASSLFSKVEEYMTSFDIIIKAEDIRWFPLNKSKLEKWVPAESVIFVHPSRPDTKVDLYGLHAVDDHYMTDRDGIVRFSSEGIAWIGEPN
jgi:hypothetical protein